MISLPFIMVTANYIKYLRSDKWKRKREMVFNYYGKRCYACRTYKGPIQVHHMSYKNFGNERLSDLLPLCLDCHRKVTWLHKRNGRRNLRKVTLQYVAEMRKRRFPDESRRRVSRNTNASRKGRRAVLASGTGSRKSVKAGRPNPKTN